MKFLKHLVLIAKTLFIISWRCLPSVCQLSNPNKCITELIKASSYSD